MKENIKKILKQELMKIKPNYEEVKTIDEKTKKIIDVIEKNIKKKKVKAQVFVGGSSAKDTLIKKKKYDIDLFVRFDSKYDEKKISDMLQKLIPKGSVKQKGSRDYFSIKKDNIDFEMIPVMKIKNPKQAKNITDLSYFHVNYVKKQINKHKGLSDEIRLAKAFTYYQECYGAESYINGFSGYAIELLIIYYKSFIRFLKAMTKIKDRLIIDMEQMYKNKNQLIQEMNKSKLSSPIILIDPTNKERNALAALSEDTFKEFQKKANQFLKNPSVRFFIIEDKKQALEKKYKDKLKKIQLKTKKQAGDIGGTKLKKFYNYFIRELEEYFIVDKSDFEYDEDKNIGTIYLVVKPKKEIIFNGPPVKMKKALKNFRKQHKKIKIKNNRAYAVEKINIDLAKFLKMFKKDKRKVILEMGVSL